MVEIDEEDCRLPFWGQTLARNSRTLQLLPLDQVVDNNSISSLLKGFIYHVNRCGSTLVCNALKISSQCRVLSEPFVFQQLLDTHRGSAAQRLSWLRKLMALHLRALCPRGEAMVIKWPSLLALYVDDIELAFHGAPAIFLYRNPVEVLVSIKREPLGGAEFIRPEHLGEVKASDVNVPGPPSGDLRSNALYIAHLCRKISAANHVMAVDYAELPGAICQYIVPRFNISFTPSERDAILEISRIYSKDAKAKLKYVSDSESKLSEATPEILALAADIISPALHGALAVINKPDAAKRALRPGEGAPCRNSLA